MAERVVRLLLILLLVPISSLAQTKPALSQALAKPALMEPKDILRRESPAIVKVYNVDRSGKQVAFGTGFVVRSDGVVVTNFHVVRGAADAQIQLQNQEIYENVMVLDYDVRHDVALLKIRAVGLPTVTLGDSSTVEQGDRAYAIGCPRGMDYTISDGLISAKRVIEGTELLQISVPISHGSSGGPLYNNSGQVIGITTAGIEEGQNLNFAVPLKYATVMLDSPPKNITLAQLTSSLPAERGERAESPSGGTSSGARSYTDPSESLSVPILPGWQVDRNPPENMLLSVKKGNEAAFMAYWISARNADDAFNKNKAAATKIYGRLGDYGKKTAVGGEDGRRVCVQAFEVSVDGQKGLILVGALQNGTKLIGILGVGDTTAAFADVIEILKGLQF